MRGITVIIAAAAAVLTLVAGASAHGDHPAVPVMPTTPPATGVLFGGPGAVWEPIATIPMGNPLTDLDFFTKNGETYMSVGTLAVGPNAGGQTIVRLTQGGEVVAPPFPGSPAVVSSHPSASCVSDPSAALGLQHDAEATPKGDVIFNTTFPDGVVPDRRDAQLILDATDQRGRCHDQGPLGVTGNPRGGLELIDITDVTRPVEIGLTSHIGEAHTVNVDPKRPHIAFAVTSDAVGLTCNAARTSCTRANEDPNSTQRFNLDGFELIDLSSCLDFPALTSVEMKRMLCEPEVYRYRWSSPFIARGHTLNHLAGCHELEIYPDDRLTCASISATILFDLSGAFDDNGTPHDYTDDKPRGTPLPCRVRDSVSAAPYATAAKVVDCVVGENGQDLTVPAWLGIGAPSLEGVVHLGSAFHMGRPATGQLPPQPATEDIEVSHEAELTDSRRLILATDERGGGVTPPGASCVTSPADNELGNGGIHAYRVDSLLSTSPNTAAAAWQSYARTPTGAKAIYRAPIRTQAQADLCTSHVFHQIPGQNRIFMGWYTQGTQVVDFVEHADGTVEFREAGFFIPANANTWTSAVFKMQENADGTFTYWGATGDFNLGTAGRSAVDIWKVTLPAPPRPLGSEPHVGSRTSGGGWLASTAGMKINFGFQARLVDGISQGNLQLNDQAAGAKIHIAEVFAVGPVEGCGSIADGPRALQFRGTGSLNGEGDKSFRVCVEDGGEGAGAVDRFFLECTSGCEYTTGAWAASDAIGGGNIHVRRPGGADSGASGPTTIILDPLLATGLPLTQTQVLTAKVLNADGEPLAGAAVTLRQTSGTGVKTLSGVTAATGLASFVATGLLGTVEFTATADGVTSNAIQLAPGG